MNLKQKNLVSWSIASMVLSLYQPLWGFWLKIHYFIPFLILVFYQKQLLTTLWISLFCGLFLDLFNHSHFFPMHGVTFTLTSWVLYPQQKNFFADTLSTLPIMTFFYSSLFTLIYFIVNNIFEEKLQVSFYWAMTDLLIMPGLDVLFSLLFYMLPSLLFGRRQLKGQDYFLN